MLARFGTNSADITSNLFENAIASDKATFNDILALTEGLRTVAKIPAMKCPKVGKVFETNSKNNVNGPFGKTVVKICEMPLNNNQTPKCVRGILKH